MKTVKHFIIFASLIFGMSANAQNIGFEGKVWAVGAIFEIDNMYLDKRISRRPVSLLIERSINYNTSIEFYSIFSKFNLDFEPGFYLEDFDKYSTDEFYFSGGLEGDIKGRVWTNEFRFKYYTSTQGSISPYGLFISAGIRHHLVKLGQVNAYTGNDLKARFAHDETKEIGSALGISYGVGTKNICFGKVYLQSQLGFNIDGLKNYDTQRYYQSHMKAALDQVKKRVLLFPAGYFTISVGYVL